MAPYLSCPQLLQALEYQLKGGPQVEEPFLEQWAQDVVQCLREASPYGHLEPDEVLFIAASALRYTSQSRNWPALLEGTLQQPKAFARTLLIIMHDQTPAPAFLN